MRNMPNLQGGFAAIAAIFLVVVLAALGVFMVAFSNTQHVTAAQDVQGSRAYWAARAALEWAIVANTSACASTTLSVEGFSVAVGCSKSDYLSHDATASAANMQIFQITAVARTGSLGSIGYIERSVSASVCRLSVAPYNLC